jgi:hypothetical protein
MAARKKVPRVAAVKVEPAASGAGPRGSHRRQAPNPREVLPGPETRPDVVPPGALRWSLVPALAALALYLAQAPPVSGDKDGSELTLVLALGGAAHPTGYPIYTLLGHAFVALLHALGASSPWAANAWSAVGGAVAVLFLHALTERLLPASLSARPAARFGAALGPTALFALNPVWTYEATLAEVYSWHLAWVMATCWVFHRLIGVEARLDRAALGWGLLCGVGLAHHATSIFVSAPLTVVLAVQAARRARGGRRHVGLLAAGACLPLLSYAFIAYRAVHPAAWSWPTLEPGWGGLSAHVTGAAYQGLLGSFNPSPEQRELLSSYVYPFLFPPLVLLVVGAVLGRVERWTLVGLSTAAVSSCAWAFIYGVPDPSSYFLASMAIASASIVPAAA